MWQDMVLQVENEVSGKRGISFFVVRPLNRRTLVAVYKTHDIKIQRHESLKT